MKHIVYLITFEKRKENNQFPYYYIGLKFNCILINNKIITNNGKNYYGSSKFHNYKNIVKENIDNIKIETLFESDNKELCTKEESILQKQFNVVLSPEYFNQSISCENNKFINPDYGTYKNIISNKICRLPKDHPDVISGLWVGVSHGRRWFNNGVRSITSYECPDGWKLGRLLDCSGDKNGFYGKKHKKEDLIKGVKIRKRNGSYKAWNKGIKKIN